MLVRPNTEPDPSCLYKTRGDILSTYFQDQRSRPKHSYRNRGDLPFILSALNQNSSWGLQWRLTSPDEKTEKHQPLIQGKMGFPGMSMPVPCMIDKMTLKSPRESSRWWETRERAGHAVPAVSCAVLTSAGPHRVRLSCELCLIWIPVRTAVIPA